MKNKKYLVGVVVILLFEIQSVVVFGQFSVEASIRPRPEYRHGYKSLNTIDQSALWIVTQRTCVGLNYQTDKINAKIALQDVRVWGDEMQFSSTGAFGDQASIDLAEAWFSYKLFSEWTLKVGRQAFSFDDERLLARRNWNQNGLFYDAVSMRFLSGDWDIQSGFSYNNSSDGVDLEAYNPGLIKSLAFAHGFLAIDQHWNVSLLTLVSSVNASDTNLALYTKGSSGINLSFKNSRWSLFSSFYYQYGKDAFGGIVKDVSAYNLNFTAQFNASHFSVKAGCSVLSGDGAQDVSEKKTHLFDLLYGARHKYYGLMDYFSNLRKSTDGGGLNDFYANLEIPISTKVQVNGASHLFYLNKIPATLSDVTSQNSALFLASEWDFWIKADFWEVINLQSGYSFLLPGSQLKSIQNIHEKTSFSSWAWVMVTLQMKSRSF